MKRKPSPFSALVHRVRSAMPPARDGWRRRCRSLLGAGVVIVASLALAALPAIARQPDWRTAHWVGTWGTAPAGPPLGPEVQTFSGQTLRLVVHTSIGGKALRIRISNELGTTPLRIGEAHLALRESGSGIVAASDRPLTFSGKRAITIPPGTPALSDPVELDVPALSDLAVSLYLPEPGVRASTVHGSAFQTSYVSLSGNFSGAATFPTARTIGAWPFLTEVDVDAPGAAAIVALGDSITDGANTTADTNQRWPGLLALRLQTSGGQGGVAQAGTHNGAPVAGVVGWSTGLGVVNRGISGNRLLRDPGEQPLFGRAALARFDRDVLATAGVRYIVVLIGINDIGHPGSGAIPAREEPTPEELFAGYRQLIARAHARGIAIYGATLTPFEDTAFSGYYSPDKERIRQAVNTWIRSGGEFDGVIDFDRALRDPNHPARVLPAYDSGDHLHPNDLGMQAMANAIPLQMFRGAAAATPVGAAGTPAAPVSQR